MYNSIRTEVEFAKPIITYLEEHGWSVYQEVQIDPSGKVADIIATFGKLTWIIECKTSLSLKLLEQIYGWRGRANFLSIAIPSSVGSGFTRNILERAKIGVLTVRHSKVFENIRPGLNRKVTDIKKYLLPEHKIWAMAGSKSGYYSTFKQTKQNLEWKIQDYPNGILFKDFIKSLEHHYHTESTAKSCLRQWIDSGVISGAKIVNQANKLWIYPVIVDKPK